MFDFKTAGVENGLPLLFAEPKDCQKRYSVRPIVEK
jgi:hypothetical protein